MKLFVDEDTGARVARALAELGVDVRHIGGRRAPRRGTVDQRWIPYAGRDGRPVLSRNLRILITDAEVDLLVREKVGIVFLPQHIDRFSLMRLLMRYWPRIERLDQSEPRPFAYFLGIGGRLSKLPLSGDSASLRRRLSRFGGGMVLPPGHPRAPSIRRTRSKSGLVEQELPFMPPRPP